MAIKTFKSPSMIISGVGAAEKIGLYTANLGSKALLVTDKVLNELGVLDGIKDSLRAAKADYAIYEEVVTEPSLDYVNDGLKIFQENKCDFVISVGGGSAIDTAKSIAIMCKQGGKLQDYAGYNNIPGPGVPHIAVPTTAGTGSEVTIGSVITDNERNVKMLFMDPALMPTIALVDPIMTISAPQNVTASTGMDALTHAIEAYVSVQAQATTDALAIHAIELIAKNLPKAWADGKNIEARSNMMIGSMEAGLSFSNSSVALVHGMARPLGAYFHTPHGIANACLLATVSEFSLCGAPERYAAIAKAMGENVEGLSVFDAADLCIDALKRLVETIKIPSLGGIGIPKERFDEVVEQMAKDSIASGSPNNNPRKCTVEELVELYYKAY